MHTGKNTMYGMMGCSFLPVSSHYFTRVTLQGAESMTMSLSSYKGKLHSDYQ